MLRYMLASGTKAVVGSEAPAPFVIPPNSGVLVRCTNPVAQAASVSCDLTFTEVAALL
jgi:hypothetical protein